jgi:cell division protein FtsL
MTTAVYTFNKDIANIDSGAAITLPSLGFITLLLIVLLSAFAVVYLKDYKRQLFNELEGLHQVRDSLQIEASQLLLEENTWAAPARVETVAVQQLAMELPSAQTMVMVNT